MLSHLLKSREKTDSKNSSVSKKNKGKLKSYQNKQCSILKN